MIVLLTAILGVNYVVWRWLFSVNWGAWWIAVPLVLAETYSLVDSLLFGMTMWRLKRARRAAPGARGPDRRRPHRDLQRAGRAGDGDRAGRPGHPLPARDLDPRRRQPRPRCARAAEAAGIGYITRSADWDDHAAARQGRQPQQRAARHRGRVPAHPRRRPGPRAGDPRPDAGLLPATSESRWSRRRSTSSTSPTATRSAARPRCSTARSSRARTAGTPRSSAAPTP